MSQLLTEVDTFERVRRIFADTFEMPLDRVHAATSPDDVASWDSLRHLNMVLTLEQEFGLELTPEEIEQLLSVELVVALVEEKRGEAS